ncbi:MAG: 3-phosphoglycerate dehydrogenase [Oscillospiraceae bacterium]|jgi:D-3-phosphoglycerate dehydrogenase|nr:3-phosphoglycerate dehydrogenase [Oscillospiraceae bacterium]
MPAIQTYNKIAKIGLDRFPEGYTCGDAVENPAAAIVRSASLLDTDFPASMLAIARAGAGYNNIPVDKCTAQGICVFNTPGANANAVKELVICSLLLASRKVAAALDWAKTLKGQGAEVGKLVEKGKAQFTGPEIAGKTLGLIGLGAIGGLVANAAVALGMSVFGYDPFLSDTAKAKLDTSVQIVPTVDEVLAVSDYVSLHLPLTPDTKGFINTRTLEAAKDGVRILNFSRDGLVKSADILEGLASGKIAAYITDFPTDDLIGADGVTAIPHLGASTPESEDNCAVMAADQIKAYLEWGAVRNSVNLPKTDDLPPSFGSRVCVIHKAGDDAAVLSALGGAPDFTVTGNRGEIGYTIADYCSAPDTAAVASLPGVVRVRVI